MFLESLDSEFWRDIKEMYTSFTFPSLHQNSE